MRSCLILVLLLGACFDAQPTTQVQSAIESPNALSLNALSLNALSLNALSLNALSLNGIDIINSDAGNAACSSEDGRSVLKYTVACALPQGTNVSCPGYPPFAGHIGLAPEWMNQAIGIVSQQWVSACLLAHVNNFAVPIQISLTGLHPALARSPDEQATFVYKEADFYGNLFSTQVSPITSDGVKSGQLGRNACQNQVVLSPVSDWYLRMRVCAMPGEPGYTACNFVDAGRCHPAVGQTLSACLFSSGEADWRCAGGQIYPGWAKEEDDSGIDHSTMVTNQVISVYLRQSDAHDLCTAACLVAVGHGWLPASACDSCPDEMIEEGEAQYHDRETSAAIN